MRGGQPPRGSQPGNELVIGQGREAGIDRVLREGREDRTWQHLIKWSAAAKAGALVLGLAAGFADDLEPTFEDGFPLGGRQLGEPLFVISRRRGVVLVRPPSLELA